MIKKKKTKLKKQSLIAIIGIVLVIGIIVSICFFTRNSIEKSEEELIIDNINKHSNLPIAYMDKWKEGTHYDGYEELGNFMSHDFYNDDIKFSYYGYPTDESEYYLGEVVLYTDKYNILGITVGDNYKEAIKKIEKYGYEKDNPNDNYEVKLTLGKFTITIQEQLTKKEEKNVVDRVTLKASSKYLGNRQY